MPNEASKLNLGCGTRFVRTSDWLNVDFPGSPPAVRRIDMRKPLPFTQASFDFAYSSHVLDHFPLCRIEGLLREIHFLIRPGGVLRVSVPDLFSATKAYLSSFEENRAEPVKHRWHTLCLLDQLTRTEPGGEKAKFLKMARMHPEVQEWLRPLLGAEMIKHLEPPKPISLKIRLKAWVKRFIVGSTVEQLGERHYWFFDQRTLGAMLAEAGFDEVRVVTWQTSWCDEFLAVNLDAEDGREYKPFSLYMEARKQPGTPTAK